MTTVSAAWLLTFVVVEEEGAGTGVLLLDSTPVKVGVGDAYFDASTGLSRDDMADRVKMTIR